MNKKITIVGIILIILLILNGCNYKVNDNNLNQTNYPEIQECINICNSHNWSYDSCSFKGYGRYTCFCKDKDNAIWVFNL